MTLWKPVRLRWCSQADVLTAFQIVGREIRNKCRRFDGEGLSQADASELAGRIREQRELVRQLIDSRDGRRVRHLLKLNRKLRRRLLELAEKNGLEGTVLRSK
ncbi:MAG: hypothetical protein HUU20_13540 [Pirellulales bacterium]|nr:hypothetical protein [Pirellulales bacterium]